MVVRANAGDAVFIPEGILFPRAWGIIRINLHASLLYLGWWHLVQSDECTVAINFWFRSPLYKYLTSDALAPYIIRASALELTSKNVSTHDDYVYSSTPSTAYATYAQFVDLVHKLSSSIETAAAEADRLALETEFVNCKLV